MKGILVILDGVSDLPCKELEGETPLESANTPNLDFFARKGEVGYMHPIKENYAPESDTAVVSILGNDPFISSRGQFEALGAGIKLQRGDLALRTNFATIHNMRDSKIIDRRVGRTLTKREAAILGKAISKQLKLGPKFLFRPTVQHRGVLVLRGGFSDNITNTDPSYHVKGKFKAGDKLRVCQPLDDDDNSQYSADLINRFIIHGYGILNKHPVNLARKKKGLLPANIILTRDAGIEMPKLKKMKNWASIVYMPIEKGITKAAGMQVFSFLYPRLKGKEVYKNLYEGLNTAIKFSIKILKKKKKKFDYFYVHIKETDIPGHDGRPADKKNMIEILDDRFFAYLRKLKGVKIVITADHSTPCKNKSHTSDPVPVLLYNPKTKNKKENKEQRFTEKHAKNGQLGKIYGKDFLKKVGF